MSTNFKDKWLESVKNKNSILCAGLDPAEYDMGREEKGLPENVGKLKWSLDYLEAVAPFVAGVKPNLHYWTHPGGLEDLQQIMRKAHELNLPVILDAKVADIGSTNDAAFYHGKELGFDAITFSPFAGNLEESVRQANNRGLGLISMCLMSNDEFEKEKNILYTVWDKESKDFALEDQLCLTGMPPSYVRNYVRWAQKAQKHGAHGIVIGVTNHITEHEVSRAAHYFKGLSLSPGLGAQGGAADVVISNYGEKTIANVGRGLMFPNGSNSTPEQQELAAKNYLKKLNDLRR